MLSMLNIEINRLIRKLSVCNNMPEQNPTVKKIIELVSKKLPRLVIKTGTELYRARPCLGTENFLKGRGVVNGKFDIRYMRPASIYEEDTSGEEFAGFNKDGCDAPPLKLNIEGRANKKGERVLYVAETAKTAIYEIKPSIGSVISVAKMKVTETFSVVDLTEEITNDSEADSLRKSIENLFLSLAEASRHGYVFTQWFSNIVAKHGADVRGIKYSSTMDMNGGGINIVVFEKCSKDCDLDNCFGVEAVESDVYCIDDVDFRRTRFKPLREDKFGAESDWELEIE